MHIAFNGFFWNQPDTGSGQYTRQLIYHLNRHVTDLEMTLLIPHFPNDAPPQAVPPSVHVERISAPAGNLGKIWWEQRLFPHACGQLKVDLAHVPYWGSPLRSPVPVVVTVHDIITYLLPEYRRSWRLRAYNALVAAAARGAAHIITDSIASKDEICQHLSIKPSRVTPIHLATTDLYQPEPNLLLDMATLQKYDLPDFYILYLGGYSLHKNVTTLLLAYTYVVDALGDDYPLILAGRKPEASSERVPDYDAYLEKLNIQEKVHWIGYVAEEDKPALYRHCSSFVFPSRYEGFGLPPLEAMACGAPVITTSQSSLPEVVGDAAFAVDPDDERGMAGAIIASLIQDELAASLKQAGLAQAKKFSWEKTATDTLLVYTGLLNRA